MQGLHVAPAFNDENSTTGPLLHAAFKENSTSLQAPLKQGSALKSARKAFGNITNIRSDAAQQQPAGTVVKRRAFGDITNSTIKQQPGAASTKKIDPFSSQLKPSSTKAPTAPGVATAEACMAAPWWETAPPERSAGKTWEQLLEDREQQEDADVERSVQQLLAGFRDLSARCFQVHPDDSSEDDELQLLGPPPPPPSDNSSSMKRIADTSSSTYLQQATSTAGCPFGLSSSSGCIADVLPDVELPSTDLEDDAAAAAAAAWPVSLPRMEQAAAASFPAGPSCSTGGSGSWSASVNRGQGVVAEQHALQQHAASLNSTPARPGAGSSERVVGLKSPEALPW